MTDEFLVPWLYTAVVRASRTMDRATSTGELLPRWKAPQGLDLYAIGVMEIARLAKACLGLSGRSLSELTDDERGLFEALRVRFLEVMHAQEAEEPGSWIFEVELGTVGLEGEGRKWMLVGAVKPTMKLLMRARKALSDGPYRGTRWEAAAGQPEQEVLLDPIGAAK